MEEIDVVKHNEKMNDKSYAEYFNVTSFEEGKTLYLTVVVKDRVQSQNLFKWIYSKDENGAPMQVAGCELHQISWAPQMSKDEWKRKMIELIDSV
jgi:hypothetical protein